MQRSNIRKFFKVVKIPYNFIFEYLGTVVAVFIPVAILLLQDGVEIRIDRSVVIDNPLNFKWFFGLFFTLVLLAIVKKLLNEGERLIDGILSLISLILMVLLLFCSIYICTSTVSWLNDIPVALSTDNSSTSSPILDLSTRLSNDQNVVIVRPQKISSYKKNARISYIKKAKTDVEQELRWEKLINDADFYVYEGRNDFWIYLREFYIFLQSMDDDYEVTSRGFSSIESHIGDIGSVVDDNYGCSYVATTLSHLSLEKFDWRVELWAHLVGKYITVALTKTGLPDETRVCWIESVPYYLFKSGLDVGNDGH